VTTFLADVQAYIGFGPADAAILREVHAIVSPHFAAISRVFYDRIVTHPRARSVITGGEPQIERLRQTLVAWMGSGLLGPHDEAFYERRARIGRIHVEIGLPQQYMVTAMNVIRVRYRELLEDGLGADRSRCRDASNAVDRLLDTELAIMLQTYRMDSEERLRRRERLATIGQIAASIGHDLRDPLGVIGSSVFLLRRRSSTDAVALRHVEKIAKQVASCQAIVADLLDLARDKPLELTRRPVQEAIADALAAVALGDDARATVQAPAGLQILADHGLLQRALVNLLQNAAIALAGRGGAIAIEAAVRDAGVELSVSDDGPGFDPSMLARAFEPLVTTRPNGTGLGLALVSGVAERHGGRATAENQASGGARVTVWLPQPAAIVEGAQ
jgi:signal transduction histidine kinase